MSFWGFTVAGEVFFLLLTQGWMFCFEWDVFGLVGVAEGWMEESVFWTFCKQDVSLLGGGKWLALDERILWWNHGISWFVYRLLIRFKWAIYSNSEMMGLWNLSKEHLVFQHVELRRHKGGISALSVFAWYSWASKRGRETDETWISLSMLWSYY